MRRVHDDLQSARATISKLKPGEEVDAWGLSREHEMEPLAAEWALNRLVRIGEAAKRGNWYRRSEQPTEEE